MNKHKGFSLVELIVVIVIMLVLAAVMVPSVYKYIKKAGDVSIIYEARELLTATQVGIIDAFVEQPADFKSTVKLSKFKKVKQSYGFFSSYLLATQQGNASSESTTAKNVITNSILEFVNSKKGKEMRYKFYSGMITGGFDISNLKGDDVAFIVLYGNRGEILYMQYARRGQLVTYDGSDYTVQEGGKFITFN